MAKKFIDRYLRNKIIRCHKEGWFKNNIAEICRTDLDTVEQVFREKNILM